MDYREYLNKLSAINLTYIAEKMWPTNGNAKTYLSRKLNGTGRPWTESDNEKARVAIHELGVKLVNDTTIVVNDTKPINSTPKAIIKPDTEKKFNIWNEMDRLRGEK